MQDLVAGRIDLMIDSPIGSVPQVRAGTIKAFAVTAKDRLVLLRHIFLREFRGKLRAHAGHRGSRAWPIA